MDRDQVRAARALLRWTAEDLARESKVGLSTIKRMESGASTGPLTAANAHAIQRALEDGGIEFIPENGGGLGVRLKERRTPG